MINKWLPMYGYKKSHIITCDGVIIDMEKHRFLNLGKNVHGYTQANIRNNMHLVHRLVAKTFIKNPNKYECINHKDGDKQNNSVRNLEWCTRAMNNQHAFRTGLSNNSGENCGTSKLKTKQIIAIRNRYKKGGISQYKLAKIYGVSQPHIGDIVLGQRWKHLNK